MPANSRWDLIRGLKGYTALLWTFLLPLLVSSIRHARIPGRGDPYISEYYELWTVGGIGRPLLSKQIFWSN